MLKSPCHYPDCGCRCECIFAPSDIRRASSGKDRKKGKTTMFALSNLLVVGIASMLIGCSDSFKLVAIGAMLSPRSSYGIHV